ncbi:DEAD/DEAH box helicase [Anaerofilum sp. BX8]|uniref:DEAD/DEAH box helicase n=1 Tax=Anaerofilum hominis TaxID=2763016 RepID=A0A923I5S3_9FIRM|nr:DEAD/DEAH box helicase [Anaerofilum hominis]MBC5580831.1 DEAD/DEAH box helicase [Anaerofilum hominis]
MDYSSLGIKEEIQQAIDKMGFTELTEVQEKAIPLMLAGRDVVAKAPTGTGKTCAFGVPLIQGIDPALAKPQALVLCPTRELCLQITEELGSLTAFLPGIRTAAVYGGQPIEKQIRRLKEGVQIVVATPGRMQDHMDHRTIDVRGIAAVVLDEADEMLDMGFYRDVMKIVDHLPARRHLHMFSATISREVMDISWKYQKNPEEITVEPVEESAPRIDQYSLLTTGRNKLADMTEIMVRHGYTRAMVFCNTKYATEALCNQLIGLNFKAECLNGDMPQSERNKIMGRFRAGDVDVLVATDVAARGIDVSDVQVVFNYDLPQTNEYYLHRIGRTGRAKKEGVSFLLYTAEDKKRVREMIRYTQSEVTEVRLQFGKLVEVQPNPWSAGGIRVLYSN